MLIPAEDQADGNVIMTTTSAIVSHTTLLTVGCMTQGNPGHIQLWQGLSSPWLSEGEVSHPWPWHGGSRDSSHMWPRYYLFTLAIRSLRSRGKDSVATYGGSKAF